MSKSTIGQYIKWAISPTLFVSDWYKKGASSKKERGNRVKRLNKQYVKISIFLILLMHVLMYIAIPVGYMRFVIFLIIFYSLSRCNEIFMAFLKDVFDKLDFKKRDKNGLEYFERIQLALRSYIELILHYGLLYYFIGSYSGLQPFFNQPIHSLGEAIYFSVITIVSIGYGDIYPVHPIARALVIYEVMSGMLLLVVSFTVYVNLTLEK